MAKYEPDGRKFHYDNIFFQNPLDYGWVQLYQLGELCCEPNFEIGIHSQRCCELSYIISGTGTFFTDGHATPVKKGDLIHTPPIGEHYIVAGNTEPLNFAYIGFEFHASNDPFEEALTKYFRTLGCICIPDKLEVYNFLQKCIGEFYQNDEYGHMMIRSYIHQILVLAYRSLRGYKQRKAFQPTGDMSVGHVVYRVIRYVDKNIKQLSDIGTIAWDIGYSSYYLSHIFKEKMGITLQSYIAMKKIEKSKELLLQNRYSVTDIAEKMGYSSVQSYSRAFHRIVGMYPSQYLKQHEE